MGWLPDTLLLRVSGRWTVDKLRPDMLDKRALIPPLWAPHFAQLDAARNGTVMHPASAAGTDLTCGAGYEAVGRLWPAVG